jgi:hypothetical protein
MSVTDTRPLPVSVIEMLSGVIEYGKSACVSGSSPGQRELNYLPLPYSERSVRCAIRGYGDTPHR